MTLDFESSASANSAKGPRGRNDSPSASGGKGSAGERRRRHAANPRVRAEQSAGLRLSAALLFVQADPRRRDVELVQRVAAEGAGRDELHGQLDAADLA